MVILAESSNSRIGVRGVFLYKQALSSASESYRVPYAIVHGGHCQIQQL